MSESLEVDPQAALLAQQVLEAGQVIRVREHEVRRKLAEQAEIAHNREGSFEVQLAGEVERLATRMEWLHEHPRLQRFIGKSAIGIEHEDNHYKHIPDTLSTQPLTDGDIAMLRGEHLIFSGLVFWRFYDKYRPLQIKIERNGKTINLEQSRSDRTLHIEQQVKDETTGVTRSRRLFDLHPHSSITGPRVQVHGGSFDEYRGQMRRQVFAEYAQEHSGVEKFLMHYSDYPGLSNGRRTGSFEMHGLDWKERAMAEQLNQELVPRMEPGGDWEYPNKLFLELLALVKEMNLLLGTKNK